MEIIKLYFLEVANRRNSSKGAWEPMQLRTVGDRLSGVRGQANHMAKPRSASYDVHFQDCDLVISLFPSFQPSFVKTLSMADKPDDPHVQAFRNRSTDNVIYIPSVIDPRTGGRVILWMDIQSRFRNAELILSGNSLVVFLTDEKFQE